MNIEIGSGCNPQPGYIHIDIYKDANCPDAVDIIADARHLPFKNEEVDNVLMFGVFEHFGIYEIQEVMLEVWRVMAFGRIFKFDVPDFDWFIHAYLTGKDKNTDQVLDPARTEKWIMHSLFGGQEKPGMFHKWGWNEKRLREFLEKPNWPFREINMVGRQWRDGESNHLIWECVK